MTHSVKLMDKTYTIPFVKARAYREMDDAIDAYTELVSMAAEEEAGKKATAKDTKISDYMDRLVEWFCVLFDNQFSPDEFSDGYPADQLITDLVTALLKVRDNMAETIGDFPSDPAATMRTQKTMTTESK